jgi:hypothetical protein
MVTTDLLHAVLHYVMVYKNITMTLNKDLLYFLLNAITDKANLRDKLLKHITFLTESKSQ